MKIILYFFTLLFISFSAKAQVIETLPQSEIRRVVEIPPYYESETCTDVEDEKKIACAEKAMYKFVYSRIKYPAEAKKQKVEGTAVIKFVVQKDGSLSNFKIIKDPGAGCGEAALNVVKEMNKFVPAQLRRKAVGTYYSLPIAFDFSGK